MLFLRFASNTLNQIPEFSPAVELSSQELLGSAGLCYGQGVFETVLIKAGRARFLFDHLNRLALSADRLDLCFDINIVQTALESWITTVSSVGSFRMRLQLIAQARSDGFGYGYVERQSSLLLLECKALSPQSDSVSLIRITEPMPVWPKFLRGLKPTSAVQYCQASSIAQRAGFEQGALFCEQGRLIEATHANIALLSADNVWQTPADLDRGVQGVLRSLLLGKEALVAATLYESDLYAARAIVMLSSLRGVVTVKCYQGRLGEYRLNLELESARVTELKKIVNKLVTE